MTTAPPPIYDRTSKKYFEHFGEKRAAAPPDRTPSETLGFYEPDAKAERTTKITLFDAGALDKLLGPVHLNYDFVEKVMKDTGPILTRHNVALWSFEKQPENFPKKANCEADFYHWIDWGVSRPAAHAVNAVCDHLRACGANHTAPATGESSTRVNNYTSGGGAPDIVHEWSYEDHETALTVHEFKRAKSLGVGEPRRHTLDWLVAQAAAGTGYKFRDVRDTDADDAKLARKAYSVVSQTINEMLQYDTGHAVICTQTHYALLRLTSTLQLEISRVYPTGGSPTQAEDMTALVLFYTHAAIDAGTKYPKRAPTGIFSMRVIVPAFPMSVFRPSDGVFREGALDHHMKLVANSQSRSSFFPLPWLGFDGEVRSSSNDITVADGSLFFSLLATRVVAKKSRAPAAAKRLDHEFAAYRALRALQGVAIPKLIGLYTSTDDNGTVLMLSHAGQALREFSELALREKRILFYRLVRLHQSGIQHNDLEPRNVTKSESLGPIIIDFDRASLDHACDGASCAELREIGEALDLDPVAELAVFPEEVPQTRLNTYAIAIALISALVIPVYGFLRFVL